jgi:hypothetical protein
VNYPTLVAAAIVFLAFLAHTVIGNREALSTRPARSANDRTVERNWVQSMCAFQMISVDLLLTSLLLFVLGGTDWIPGERQLTLGASWLFALWAAVWLLQLALLRRGREDYLLLGQWVAWCLCSGLLYWAAVRAA